MTTRISVYPEQFVHKVNVEIDAKNPFYCIIRLADQYGMIKRMIGLNISTGFNEISIQDLESFCVGPYYLDVKNIEGKILYSTELTK